MEEKLKDEGTILNVMVPPEIRDRLIVLGERIGCSIGTLVGEAIIDLIAKYWGKSDAEINNNGYPKTDAPVMEVPLNRPKRQPVPETGTPVDGSSESVRKDVMFTNDGSVY